MKADKRKIEIFITSFVITVIAAAFLLAVYWINMKAEDSGFEGYKRPIKIEQTDDLHYLINVGGHQSAVDLTAVDKAAGYFQSAERWIVPLKIRAMTRVTLFAAEQMKGSRREAREREFFKNAGLV